MDAARWQQVKQVFHAALDRPAAERGAFVGGAAGTDDILRREVEALLAAHDGAGAFLASPTRGAGRPQPDLATAEVFDRLRAALAGRYTIERELGRGGMAIVYLARDIALDRTVAVKVLPPHLAADASSRERFLREARTAAGLSHPNIVPIHLVEERDGLVYFVMAFVDGESLGERVHRAGPLRPADAARLVQEVAWALAYAHGRGIVHRDIKPDNILIDKGSGRALVADFGIARVAATETMSQQGEVIGTLRYMSPEQSTSGAPIDGRSDLYSLGVTAFFALTGRLPFESENPATLIGMHLAEPAPPVLSVRTGVPARLAEAVDRCLAKDPAARFANGEALAEAIADARLTRRDVAPSVRGFLGTVKSALVQACGLGAIAFWTAAWAENLPSVEAVIQPFLFLIGMLGVVVAIRPVFAARAVLRAGLTEHDVGEAAAEMAMARDVNTERTMKQLRPFRWPLVRVILGALSLTSVWGLASTLEVWDLWVGNVLAIIIWSVTAAFYLTLAIKPELLAGAVSGGSPELAGMLRRLWHGPLGRGLFRLAGIGMARSASVPIGAAVPTEVLLSRAAAELFAKLAPEQRERLGDVRQALEGLERAAVSLRERRDALVSALADAGPPDASTRRGLLVAELEAARGAVEGRLGRAVTALENLRLDLLRLRAGVGGTDDLTRSIEEAHVVREAVEREIEARREVDALTPAV